MPQRSRVLLRRPFRRAALVSVGFLLMGAWFATAIASQGASVPEDPADSPVVTALSAVALGHRRANEGLRADPKRKPLLDAAAAAAASVVRVQCRFQSDGTEICERGTGAFVGVSGCVLTVGHVLAQYDDKAKLSVQLADGREFPAIVLGRGASEHGGDVNDWALLEVSGDPERLPPSLPLGEPRAGVEVVLLGFGGDAGLGAAGVVVANRDGTPLSPTWLLARIDDERGVYATPLAGAVPTGGFSGGPAVDATGAVVAVQAAATAFRDEGTETDQNGRRTLLPPVIRQRVDCASIEDVGGILAKARRSRR
ncbi:MAG: trypsin-like peptidase domain-containing protein [Planctomycetes bacterium]|nr:trypsin-like peptidase domain-containing protein [Planctomycetota bacterium]